MSRSNPMHHDHHASPPIRARHAGRLTMTTMRARYAGTCATSGQPIRPGDAITIDPVTRRASLAAPPAPRADLADHHDAYMPTHGRGRSRAQVWRQSQDARYGAGLDHETE